MGFFGGPSGSDQRSGEGLPRPTAPAERIVVIDVLRGVALLGIVLMNIPYAGLPASAAWVPTVAGGSTGIDWWAWFLSCVFIDGKARALFSILFGAGVILMTSRAESSGLEGAARSADLHYRRMLWLMAFGLVDSYLLIWPGDIIYLYGLCGLLLYPLRKLSAKALITASIVLIAIGICYGLVQRQFEIAERDEVMSIRATQASGGALTREQQETLKEWNEGLEEDFPPREDVEKELQKRRRGYFSNVVTLAPITKDIQSLPLYFEVDAISMMLLGMGLMRAGVLSGSRSRRFYALCASLCLPIGWAIAALGPLDWSRSGFHAEHISPLWASYSWSYQLQRLLIVIGYIGLVILLVRFGTLARAWRAIAAAGRLPLTNYLGQSVIYIVLLSGTGFGLIGSLARHELLIIALLIWIWQVLFSVAWSAHFAYGPLEYLWRWLTYGRRPEWRR